LPGGAPGGGPRLVCLLGILLSLFPTDDAKGMPV
jgi:hypothetical protein